MIGRTVKIRNKGKELFYWIINRDYFIDLIKLEKLEVSGSSNYGFIVNKNGFLNNWVVR